MIVLLIYVLWGEIRKREVTDFPFVLGSYCVCSGGGRRMVYYILIKQRGICLFVCLRVCLEWPAMPCMEWLPALGIQG